MIAKPEQVRLIQDRMKKAGREKPHPIMIIEILEVAVTWGIVLDPNADNSACGVCGVNRQYHNLGHAFDARSEQEVAAK